QYSVRRSETEPGGRGADAALDPRRRDHGDRRAGSCDHCGAQVSQHARRGGSERRPMTDTSMLYLDCFSGASGDMILGALLDLGLPLDALNGALGSLAIEYGNVAADRVLRASVTGPQV